MKIMKMQPHFPASLLLLLIITATVSSAQLSPVQAPATSLPAPPLPSAVPAAAPGLSSVPLVPSSPSVAPTVAVPKGPTIDIVQILRKAKKFSVLIRLLKTTQLVNQLNSQLLTSGSGGLTIFAPDDAAFSGLKAGFLNSLSDRQKVELLQFHTISSFISISNFDTLTNPVQTQAGDDSARLQLNVTTYGGGQVGMTTGAVNASITGTVYTDSKLAIYQVDKVLLPLDFVLPKAKAKAPAPALSAAKGDSPKSDKDKSSPPLDAATVNDKDNDKDDAVSDNTTSAGSLSFDVQLMGVTQLIGVAFFAAAMV